MKKKRMFTKIYKIRVNVSKKYMLHLILQYAIKMYVTLDLPTCDENVCYNGPSNV